MEGDILQIMKYSNKFKNDYKKLSLQKVELTSIWGRTAGKKLSKDKY